MSLPRTGSVVSPLRFPGPVWRYALLFQSWTQLQAWAVLVLGTLVAVNGVLMFAGSRLLPLEAVISMVLGSLPSVFMVLPAEFALRPYSPQLFAAVSSNLDALGYRPRADRDGGVVFEQNLPKWLRWAEGNVTLERTDTTIVVRGPCSSSGRSSVPCVKDWQATRLECHDVSASGAAVPGARRWRRPA